MDYEKIDMGAYNIHIIKTEKFKTTTVSVNFVDKLKKEEITIRKFLFQFLCYTTKKYNTNRLLQIKLEDLYSLIVGFSSITFGNLINSFIDIKFLNNEYSDESNLENSLDLLFELIFNPNVENRKFDSKSFNDIKEKLELIIKAQKENVEKFALNKA